MVQKADPSLTLVIGNKNYSSWSLRPWIFLKKFSIVFEEERIALFTATTNDLLAAYHSNDMIPVLLDNGFEVWDSLSIIEYLSDAYLQGAGWPVDQKARAFTRSMSAEMHSSFQALLDEMPMNCRKKINGINLSASARKDVERVIWLWEQCHQQYGQYGPWLAGAFSAVDAMFIPVALRFAGYGIDVKGFAKEYLQTVLADEWIRQWMEDGRHEKEIIAEDEIETV